jgi:hypothetical protein
MNSTKFTQYLKEQEDATEFTIKIRVRGTEGDNLLRCHDKCQWLFRDEEKEPHCMLWEGKLEVDSIKAPIRNKNCLKAIDSIT